MHDQSTGQRAATYIALAKAWELDPTPQTSAAAQRHGMAEAVSFHDDDLPELLALRDGLKALTRERCNKAGTAFASVDLNIFGSVLHDPATARVGLLLAGFRPLIRDNGLPVWTNAPDLERKIANVHVGNLDWDGQTFSVVSGD